MTARTDATAGLAIEAASVEALKRTARADPRKALGDAAVQFEALFVQMMLKSMRDSVASGGLFDSQDAKLYRSMLDQQLSQALAKRGMGLAEIMERQLGGTAQAALDTAWEGVPAPAVPGAPAVAPAGPASAPGEASPPQPVSRAARGFVERMWGHAVEAGRITGVAPQFILGQAALESGWGRSEIRTADGGTSHNLFGIKATGSWTGAVAEVPTTEYVDGQPVRRVERFRAYDSYAEAFRDYANLLANNDRYAAVLGQRTDAAAFARGLQEAGYATDPAYADKLTRVIHGTLMRTALGG